MAKRTALAAAATAGALLRLVREGELGTRSALGEQTGLSRAAINQRLELLQGEGLVVPAGREQSTGGRPPVQFRFNSMAGLVLGVDIGISASRVGVADLSARVLADVSEEISVEEGPEVVLGWVASRTEELLARVGAAGSDGSGAGRLWGVGVGVPGPVEFEAGRVVSPPFMAGWDHFPIRDWFVHRYGCPSVVDKDANIMALGEYLTNWQHLRHILFVKAGTGVGCGIVANGRIHRGTNGAAGDIGHIHLQGYGEPACRCGNTGCAEAIASGWALVRDLAALGAAVHTAADVARLANDRDHDALQAIRRAGKVLGEVLADAVNFLNPSAVIVGGTIGLAHGELLAGMREVIYQRSLPLATRDLQIVASTLGDRSGIVGAAHLLTKLILDPLAIDRRLARSGEQSGHGG
ncbi:MAG: ROK family protein [Acidimicrobiales bacterium]